MKKILLMLAFVLLLFTLANAQSYGCPVKAKSATVKDFLKEMPTLNAELQRCPAVLQRSISILAGDGVMQVSIAMKNGSTESFAFVKKGQEIGEIRSSAAFFNYLLETDEDSADELLQSDDRFGTFLSLYSNREITIKGGTFLTKFKLFFSRPVIKFFAKIS